MTPGPRKLLEVGRRRVTLVEPCPLDLTHTLARPPTTDVSLAVAPAHRGTIAAAPPAQGAPSSLVPGGAATASADHRSTALPRSSYRNTRCVNGAAAGLHTCAAVFVVNNFMSTTHRESRPERTRLMQIAVHMARTRWY